MKKIVLGNEVNVCEDYVKFDSASQQRFLDIDYMIAVFWEAYPNGSINCGKPELSLSEPTPTYNCECTVITNLGDESSRRVTVSGQAGPSNVDANITPYKAAQTNAIRTALSMLGIRPAALTPAEELEYIQKMTGTIPVPEGMTPPQAPEGDNSKENNGNNSNNGETKEKRHRRTKAEMEAARAAGLEPPKKPTKKTKKVDEQGENPSGKIKFPGLKPEVLAKLESQKEEEEVIESPLISEEDIKIPEEENKGNKYTSPEDAKAVVCSYRNLAGKTIGEIWDGRSENETYNQFIEFALTVDTPNAWESIGAEMSALRYLNSLS